MGLGDTLEKLFSVEQEVSIESAIMEFVRAGENFKSKTHIPFHKSVLAISLLEKLGEDMDTEFEKIVEYVNKDSGIPLKVKGKINPEYERPTKFINEVLIEGMILEPNLNGEARNQLLQAIKFRQDVKIKTEKDSLSKVNDWLTR